MAGKRCQRSVASVNAQIRGKGAQIGPAETAQKMKKDKASLWDHSYVQSFAHQQFTRQANSKAHLGPNQGCSREEVQDLQPGH